MLFRTTNFTVDVVRQTNLCLIVKCDKQFDKKKNYFYPSSLNNELQVIEYVILKTLKLSFGINSLTGESKKNEKDQSKFDIFYSFDGLNCEDEKIFREKFVKHIDFNSFKKNFIDATREFYEKNGLTCSNYSLEDMEKTFDSLSKN